MGFRPSRRLLVSLLTTVVIAAVMIAGALLFVRFSLYAPIRTIDGDVSSADRPVDDHAPRAIDVLVLGTFDDRCVSAMVFHIDENRQGAAFVSVPETEYCGASAPAPLLDAQAIRTLYEVEQISGIRMDHLAILDWHSIGRLVDLVGGVDVELDPAPGDSGPTRVDVAAEQIVDFVGGDVASPPDEIARILRQQRLLDAVLQNALHQEFRKQPLQLHRALHLVSTGLAVDRTWSMTQMARLVISLRNLRSRAITYHTAFPDCDGATLWEQVRSDRLGG